MAIRRLKIVNWGNEVSDIQNSSGNPLFKSVELNWSKPTLWSKDMRRPDFDTTDPFVYVLVRNHGNSRTKDHIVYIGLTTSPKTRFGNHAKARAIVEKPGSVWFSYATVDYTKGKNKKDQTLEAIEHLLIWSVSDELENEKKMFSLPGMGQNGANAWHITNTGYRFSGRMPLEIVFPWILVRPGRDLTLKQK